MRILITGGNGYVGKSLYNSLKVEHNVTLVTRQDFDLTNIKQVNEYFSYGKYFDAVIHCAVAGGSRLKPDNADVLDQNLIMYYNLLHNREHFGRFIHFGSGAEFSAPDKPYGQSKRTIARSISEKENFYNLRIYGVFDENELDTRFIKGSIERYINKEPIQIHQDKYMDFIYMLDLVKIVEHYLTEEKLLKEVGCTYNESPTLLYIANFINSLDEHKVEIKIENTLGRGEGYTNFKKTLSLSYIGLEQGIINTYNALK